MKQLLICLSVLILATGGLQAADDTLEVWHKTADFSFMISQTAYSDSWTGGEAGNATWTAKIDGLFEGPLNPSFYSKTTLKLAFGQTHVQDKDTKDWEKPVKSTDEIDLESVASYRSSWFVNPFFSFRFESQFLDASVDAVKRYFNPITLTQAAGFTKRLYSKEEQFIDARLGFAFREHLDRIVTDTVAETTEMETTTGGGFESVTDMQVKPHQDIKINSRLSVYKPIMVSDETPYWAMWEAEWKNTINMSVTKVIAVSLYLEWLYDKDIDLRGRIKETLGIGITYNLM